MQCWSSMIQTCHNDRIVVICKMWGMGRARVMPWMDRSIPSPTTKPEATERHEVHVHTPSRILTP